MVFEKKYLKNFGLILFSLLFLLICFSCADTTPAIISVHSTVVYEYENENEDPVVRLSVFVSPDTEAARLSYLEIKHEETGLMWKVTEPVIIKSGKKEYVGCTNLVPITGEKFPIGKYLLKYTDLASRSAERTFYVKSVASLEKNPLTAANYKDVANKKICKEFIFDRVILYDDNDQLIYYGGQKKEFSKLEEIRKNYVDARSIRRYRLLSDNSCGILLAPSNIPEYVEQADSELVQEIENEINDLDEE